MLVKEVMTPDAECVSPDTTIWECARRMRDLEIGSLPVKEDSKLVGMITDRDICCRAVCDALDPAETAVREIMSRDVACCFEDEDCDDAAHTMEERHVRRLAVLNRRKSVVGLLSIGDIARVSHELAGEVLEAAQPMH